MSDTGPATTAVVIVNYNAGAYLTRCLGAVAAQTHRPDVVVVVDNASSDGSLDRAIAAAGDLPLTVLRMGHNAGFAAGNNAGVRAAGDVRWIVLLNPDAFPEPGWLAELLAAAGRRPGVAMFGSLLVDAADPGRLDGVGDTYHLSGLAWRTAHGAPRAAAPAHEVEAFGPCAAAAMYRRDAFLAAGGFDERFFCYFEDVDLAFRLRLRGHRCVIVPASVVLHMGSALTGRESDFTIYHSHRNLVWTWVRDLPAPLLLRGLPHHLLMTAMTVGWYASRGQAGPILRAKRDAMLGLPRVLRERRALQAARPPGADRAVRDAVATGAGVYRTTLRRAVESVRRRRRAPVA